MKQAIGSIHTADTRCVHVRDGLAVCESLFYERRKGGRKSWRVWFRDGTIARYRSERAAREAWAATMPPHVAGSGRLRHRFWGEYSAALVIGFDSADDAAHAQRCLGIPWTVSDRDPRALWCVCGGDSLRAVIARLACFGADPAAVDSVAHSIDFGDPFAVRVPLAS